MNFSLLIIGVLTVLSSCKQKTDAKVTTQNMVLKGDFLHVTGKTKTLMYQFNKPKKELKLHDDLQEISGLSYDVNSEKLLSINDEKGVVYRMKTKDGSITKKYNFGKNGDYEGVEKVGKHIYVAKSNGKLFRYNTDSKKVKTIETPLSGINDVEGLAYDDKLNSLLLACKGKILDVENSKGVKGVYLYNLEAEEFSKRPYILLKIKELKEFVNKQAKDLPEEELKKNSKRSQLFSPSGIAIHPFSRDIYILSARGSMLLILNKRKKIEDLILFNRKNNPQPEGICFNPEGTLFISSEGKSKSGKLFIYQMIK